MNGSKHIKLISVILYEPYDGDLHGNQRYICLLAEKSRIFFNFVVPSRRNLYHALDAIGAKVDCIDNTSLVSHLMALVRLFKSCRANVVLCNNERSLFLSAIPAIFAGLPVIWFIKNMRSSFFVDLLAFIIASRVLVIAPQCLEKKGVVGRLFKRKVRVLPIGVNLQRFLKIPAMSRHTGSMRLLMLAAISPMKGVDTLLEAMQIIDKRGVSLRLRIAGSTPNRFRDFLNDMEQRTACLEHIGVEFLGWRDDVIGLLEWADIVVLPSRSEGVPRSLVEAMAAGRAVIATRVGGVPSIIEDGKTGLLVNVGDAEQLADTIVALAVDEDKRREIGERARKYAMGHHDIFAHFEILENYLKEVAVSQ